MISIGNQMDPLALAPLRTYPFPCTQCLGRFECHCAVLVASGWCLTCKRDLCSCPGEREWDDFIACDRCEGRFECLCDLLILDGHCAKCLMADCACDPPFCLVCFSIYDCDCVSDCECVSDCHKIDESEPL